MLKLVKRPNMFNIDIYDIFIDDVLGGSMEVSICNKVLHIENIVKDKYCKEKGLLKKVIEHLVDKGYSITCLPLKKYISYYEELGFKPFKKLDYDEDIIYRRVV